MRDVISYASKGFARLTSQKADLTCDEMLTIYEIAKTEMLRGLCIAFQCGVESGARLTEKKYRRKLRKIRELKN